MRKWSLEKVSYLLKVAWLVRGSTGLTPHDCPGPHFRSKVRPINWKSRSADWTQVPLGWKDPDPLGLGKEGFVVRQGMQRLRGHSH